MRTRRGFSLMEMLLVVAIIGMIAALVMTRMSGVFGKNRPKITQAQVVAASQAVERFNMDMNRYPTAEEGLSVLLKAPTGESNWSGPYFEKERLPRDAWGNELVYELDETWGYRVKSLGADGKPGGEGENADIDSRQ